MVSLHPKTIELHRLVSADKGFLAGDSDLLFGGLHLIKHRQKQTAPRSTGIRDNHTILFGSSSFMDWTGSGSLNTSTEISMSDSSHS